MIEHISKILELETSNLVHGFVWRTKISPKSGRGLGHVTPTIFGSTVGYPSDSLAFCYRFRMLSYIERLSSCSSVYLLLEVYCLNASNTL